MIIEYMHTCSKPAIPIISSCLSSSVHIHILVVVVVVVVVIIVVIVICVGVVVVVWDDVDDKVDGDHQEGEEAKS